jgi:hypothetical protein
MKRLLCGSVVLAASLGLVSCNSDPTSDFRNGPSQILAEPSAVFLNRGTVEEVVVRVVDDAGDPLPAPWEITETGSGITVARNPDFLPTTVGLPLEAAAQFIVTAGEEPQPSSFTLTSGELSIEIPVNVLPTAIETATFSNVTPAQNETVTITAEGFTFLPEAAIVIAGDSALIISNDGASVTFLPTPGSTGPVLIEKIAPSFLPTTPLSLLTTQEIAVAPLAAIPGTDDPATAPELNVPPEGAVAGFFDAPDFAGAACAFGTVCRYYKLTVTEAGVYTITMDWDIGGDIDMYVCNDPPVVADFSGCFDFAGASAAHPEIAEVALEPGTYIVVADDFGGDAIGTTLQIAVQHDPPAAAFRSPSKAVRKMRK